MTCRIKLEDGTGCLLLEDGSGYLLLEYCNDDNISAPIPGNNYSYEHTAHVWEQRRLELERLELEKLEAKRLQEEKETEIQRIEVKRQSDLADEFLQNRLIQLIKEAEAFRNEQLRIELLIKRFLQDEEDILILLLSSPF